MKTLFVSGSDTDVGKTWVVGAIALYLSGKGCSVQVVKPIESGVCEKCDSDVAKVLARCSNPLVTGNVLWSFRMPVGPVAAAENEGVDLEFSTIVSSIADLTTDLDWRIIEGAGSLATPISRDGRDWADFAAALNVEATVLVVEDRVGAIGQSRMVYEFGDHKGLNCGIWLNEIKPQNTSVRKGTLEGIRNAGIPIWGSTDSGKLQIGSMGLGCL